MTRVVFLLSKDPVVEHGGDVALSRLFIELAAEHFNVSVICLSAESGSVTADFGPSCVAVTRVPKPPVRPLSLVAGALRSRRSLVHVRFDTDALVAAIESADADVFVAEHSYMAESFLRSSLFGKRSLVVNTHVSESLVWQASRGLIGRAGAPRLVRDELRVALAANAVGTFDADEAEQYRLNGVAGARWFGLTLPPADQVDVAASPPRLVLMGTRDWPPNQEAFLHALALWPRISAALPDAQLCIIGAKKRKAPDPEYPDGVRDLGFVDDLHAFLGSCRAMIAPVKTGGGVRVKILDAARIGLPVVGTEAAVGSLGDVFGLDVFDDDAAFIAECRRLLTDRDAAVAAGEAIFRANQEYWRGGRALAAVDSLILAQPPDPGDGEPEAPDSDAQERARRP